MRQRKLIREMDITEILEQMAYDMLQDKDYRDKLKIEIQLDNQRDQSAAEEKNRLINMFMQLGMKPPLEK